DQLAQLAPRALGGDREAAVLDEAPRVDEVLDVLARRARAGRVPALDRLGTRLVARRRAALQNLVEVVTHGLARYTVRHGATPRRDRVARPGLRRGDRVLLRRPRVRAGGGHAARRRQALGAGAPAGLGGHGAAARARGRRRAAGVHRPPGLRPR